MNHKATVAGVAIAVLLMLLAGIGYAATYTGTTSNHDNTIDSQYVTLHLVDSTATAANYAGEFTMAADLLYNTVNTDGTVTYTGQGTVLTSSVVKVIVGGNNTPANSVALGVKYSGTNVDGISTVQIQFFTDSECETAAGALTTLGTADYTSVLTSNVSLGDLYCKVTVTGVNTAVTKAVADSTASLTFDFKATASDA